MNIQMSLNLRLQNIVFEIRGLQQAFKIKFEIRIRALCDINDIQETIVRATQTSVACDLFLFLFLFTL